MKTQKVKKERKKKKSVSFINGPKTRNSLQYFLLLTGREQNQHGCLPKKLKFEAKNKTKTNNKERKKETNKKNSRLVLS